MFLFTSDSLLYCSMFARDVEKKRNEGLYLWRGGEKDRRHLGRQRGYDDDEALLFSWYFVLFTFGF